MLGDSAVLLPHVAHTTVAYLDALKGQFGKYFSKNDS